MKKITLLICAFFAFHLGFAQQDLLNNENKWLLHYMVIDGTTIDVPQAPLPMYIPGIRFIGTDASNYSFTANVAGINSGFDLAPPLVISPTSFTIQQPSITLGDCSPNCLLESQYLSTIILGDLSPSRTLNYEIVDEGNNRKTLTITSPEGDIAVHGNYILSVKKFDKKRILMYPNPVKKKLHFDFKGYSIEKMNVLSLVGASIFEAKISPQQNSLDLSFLKPGIYFMKTTYKDGDTILSRFIKQ
ncbi:T9SS type A sorting domain-containing protein [uncultured Kordia sp.]|uniref:T9SS type A sorting domain-containing protein n=1 Tax=uncultured Kordia sp. TaxID=507699 RepID=UPI002635529A|nr:T9SS type A sorting domain-containing protein [uncultured Kordia sp.]